MNSVDIILAIIAAVVLYKLHSQIGKIDEDDPALQAKGKNIIPIRKNKKQESIAQPAPKPEVVEGALAGGYNKIIAKDPLFNLENFTKGAEAIFEKVIDCFQSQDISQLSKFTSKEVFTTLQESVETLTENEESIEISLISLDATILDINVSGNKGQVWVKFDSEQTRITKDNGGTIVDGDSTTVVSISDVWLFERNLQNKSRAWRLTSLNASN